MISNLGKKEELQAKEDEDNVIRIWMPSALAMQKKRFHFGFCKEHKIAWRDDLRIRGPRGKKEPTSKILFPKLDAQDTDKMCATRRARRRARAEGFGRVRSKSTRAKRRVGASRGARACTPSARPLPPVDGSASTFPRHATAVDGNIDDRTAASGARRIFNDRPCLSTNARPAPRNSSTGRSVISPILETFVPMKFRTRNDPPRF